MKKLYLTRHGQSEWNKRKKVQGQKNVPLTSKGKKQAKKLANRLKYENIDMIYSSDLIRAYETAEIINKKINVPMKKLEKLREINFGPWEGLTKEELMNNYYKENTMWLKEPHKLKLEGVETVEELKNRALEAVNIISRDTNCENILIVSHGAFLKALIIGLLDIDISCYSKFSLDNVGLSIIEFRDYNNVLKLYNDTNHLREESIYND